MKPKKHRHTIASDGTHADLKPIAMRLPHEIARRLSSLAAAAGKTRSLYISNVLQSHCEAQDEEKHT